jgi:hypothetical protein
MTVEHQLGISLSRDAFSRIDNNPALAMPLSLLLGHNAPEKVRKPSVVDLETAP